MQKAKKAVISLVFTHKGGFKNIVFHARPYPINFGRAGGYAVTLSLQPLVSARSFAHRTK